MRRKSRRGRRPGFHSLRAPQQTVKYAEKCRYIVSVMRTVDDEVCLYNYDIKGSELPEFMKALENKTLMGKLIEIEKYIPEDLA